MIGRKLPSIAVDGDVELKSFDDYDLCLGDVMRGERATMGKSLLDVQRDLRIRAAYIAAIENADPTAFDTPGFIAGYVRSYARYLNMDPNLAFDTFCRESGFTVAHGMSAQASGRRKPVIGERVQGRSFDRDPLVAPGTPFLPVSDGLFSQLEPRAIGSSLVLITLIAGIVYGAWAVLQEVQQVQVAPVDQAPVVLSELNMPGDRMSGDVTGGGTRQRADALDRLYRPQALNVPVLVARDAPISTLDPGSVGTFRPERLPSVQLAENQRVAEPVPQVVEAAAPQLQMIAVRPSWVRVRAADGTVIFEGIMASGQTYDVPLTEQPPTLRAGESGAVYFSVNDKQYGPVGAPGAVTSNVPLSIDAVTHRFQLADLGQDRDLARMVAEADAAVPQD